MKRLVLPLAMLTALVAVGCAGPQTAQQSGADAATQTPAKPPLPAKPKPPEGFVAAEAVEVVPTAEGHAVLLADQQRTTVVPIFVGESQALAIMLRMERRRFERPLTHDLLESIVARLGGDLYKVHVDGVRSDVFVATVFVREGQSVHEFDARPSDAIALALGEDVPIFVAAEVMQKAGISKDDLDSDDLDPKEMPGEEPGPGEVL